MVFHAICRFPVVWACQRTMEARSCSPPIWAIENLSSWMSTTWWVVAVRKGEWLMTHLELLFFFFCSFTSVLDQWIYDESWTGSVSFGRRDLRNGVRLRWTSVFVYWRIWDSAARPRRTGRTVSIQVNIYNLSIFFFFAFYSMFGFEM